MTLTMWRGNDDSYVMVGCKDERLYKYPYANYDGYKNYWVNIDADAMYSELSELAEWVNTKLGEDFLLEID